MASNPNALPANFALPEPDLLFSGGKTHMHPLRGLNDLGPYSAGLGLVPKVRLAYLAPADLLAKIDYIVGELRARQQPKDAVNYYITYDGFDDVFRSELIPATDALRVSTPPECNALAAAGRGHDLVNTILQGIGALIRMKHAFDVLILYLCSYSHASYISALQVGQAHARVEDQRMLCEHSLGIGLFIMSRFSLTHSELFPASQAVLAANETARRLAQMYRFDAEDMEAIYNG